MQLADVTCPHCFARGVPALAGGGPPSSRRGPPSARGACFDGAFTCRDCLGSFLPTAGGVMALPLPDQVLLAASKDRFALVVRGFFVTFGAAPADFRFELRADTFSWPEPVDLGPLRLKPGRLSADRASILRFAWRRFARSAPRELETATDLVMLGRSGEATRLGFEFPGHYPAGASIATLLSWAHERWFEAHAYRSRGASVERPPLAILRRDGKVESIAAGDAAASR